MNKRRLYLAVGGAACLLLVAVVGTAYLLIPTPSSVLIVASPTPAPISTPRAIPQPSPTPNATQRATEMARGERLEKQFAQIERILRRRGAPTQVHALEFSPDGKTLAVAFTLISTRSRREPVRLELRDIRRGTVWRRWIVPNFELRMGTVYRSYSLQTAASVAFSPDGRYLAASGGSVRIWDSRSGQLRHVLPGAASSVAFSPDGQWIAASNSSVNSLDIWHRSTGRLRNRLGFLAEVGNVAFSPSGRTVNSSSGLKWRLQSVETARAPNVYNHGGGIGPKTFSRQGRFLALADGYYAGYDAGGFRYRQRLEVRETRDNRLVARLPFGQITRAAALSSDATLLATAERVPDDYRQRQRIRVWNVPLRRVTRIVRADIWNGPGTVEAMAFSPDGRTLAIGGFGCGKIVRLIRVR